MNRNHLVVTVRVVVAEEAIAKPHPPTTEAVAEVADASNRNH